jgi:hypothetical protein
MATQLKNEQTDHADTRLETVVIHVQREHNLEEQTHIAIKNIIMSGCYSNKKHVIKFTRLQFTMVSPSMQTPAFGKNNRWKVI